VRVYIEQIYKAAGFLVYEASEQQLVDRIVKNVYPSILAHAAFIHRPRSLEEVYSEISLMQERSVVCDESLRQASVSQFSRVREGVSRNVSRSNPRKVGTVRTGVPEFWYCGRSGHISRTCPQKPEASEGRVTRRSVETPQKILGNFLTVRTVPRNVLLWTMVVWGPWGSPFLPYHKSPL
jgi:hypothetical protein